MKQTTLTLMAGTLLLTATLASRGKKQKKENDNEQTTEQPKTDGTAAQGNAADCAATAVTFKSGDVNSDGFEIKYSEAKLWDMASGDVKYPAIVIMVANYTPSGSYLQEPATDKEMRVMITLSGKAGEPLKTGDYDIANESGFGAGYGVNASVHTQGKASAFINAKGKATITYLSADKVCGTIDVSDSNTSIKGSFSIKLEKSGY